MKIPGFSAECALAECGVSYAGRLLHASGSAVTLQAINIGGGGLSNQGDCVGRYMKCVIGCYGKSTDYLQGCLDSCRASLNLCQSTSWGTNIGTIRL